MLSRPLGPSLPAVTTVGYGGMHLSSTAAPRTSPSRSFTPPSMPATPLDTADVYCLDQNDIGHNERLIARALREAATGRTSWSRPKADW
jgi:aryl-alcohol dehydrogenase-like predicted oxidoreductase